jgi:hypothetical protein
MSIYRNPIIHDPDGWISDGRETVGDAGDRIVPTLTDRLPIGIFKYEKEARRAIHETLRMRRAAA